MNKTITNEAFNIIKQFNHLNASRAPITAFLPIVDADNLLITLRGSNIVFKGIAGFADHQIGKLIYFDQKFDCELQKSQMQGNKVIIETKGSWYARTWQSPAPYSQQLIADLSHTWELVKKDKQSTYMIVTHICETFSYRAGFSPTDIPRDFHLSL